MHAGNRPIWGAPHRMPPEALRGRRYAQASGDAARSASHRLQLPLGTCVRGVSNQIHPPRRESEFAGYTHTAEAVTSEPRDRSSRHFTDYTYTA